MITVTMTFGHKSLCACGLSCPLMHVPIGSQHKARGAVMDWGDGFRTAMLPACEARKAWAGDYPADMLKTETEREGEPCRP